MRSIVRLPFVLATLLSIVAQPVLSQKTSKRTHSKIKNEIAIHLYSTISNLDPFTTVEADASYVGQEIWESLNSQNPRTLEPIPQLASLPAISSDRLLYTFTLNSKARWSDGRPVTAEDVIFTYKTILNPALVNGQALMATAYLIKMLREQELRLDLKF